MASALKTIHAPTGEYTELTVQIFYENYCEVFAGFN